MPVHKHGGVGVDPCAQKCVCGGTHLPPTLFVTPPHVKLVIVVAIKGNLGELLSVFYTGANAYDLDTYNIIGTYSEHFISLSETEKRP